MPTILSALAVVAMCVFIFFMSAQPADDSTEVSMGVVDAIVRFFVPGYDQMDPAAQYAAAKGLEHVVRKIAHFSEYALLGVLMANLMRRIQLLRRRNGGPLVSTYTVAAWIFAALYAASDEVHQLFVPGRAFMVSDIIIDWAGISVGIFIAVGFFALAARRRSAE